MSYDVATEGCTNIKFSSRPLGFTVGYYEGHTYVHKLGKLGKKLGVPLHSEVRLIECSTKDLRRDVTNYSFDAVVNLLQTQPLPFDITFQGNVKETEPPIPLQLKKHSRYFKNFLDCVPQQYEFFDPNCITMLFFLLHGLAMTLSAENKTLEECLNKSEDKCALLVDWIYSLQVPSSKSNPECLNVGFVTGPWMGYPFDPSGTRIPENTTYLRTHLTGTCNALLCLKLLGDDFSRVDRKGIIAGLKHHQQPSGNFQYIVGTPECSQVAADARFIYCACVICHLLDDFSGIDKEKTIELLFSCQNYDGGFGLRPRLESHGGATFCCVASLTLCGALKRMPAKKKDYLIRWCIMRQGTGYEGRPYKPEDSCYSLWLGATLKLFGVYELTARQENRAFNLACQSGFGGLSKVPNSFPDFMHAYLGLCGLCLMDWPGDNLPELDPLLIIPLLPSKSES